MSNPTLEDILEHMSIHDLDDDEIIVFDREMTRLESYSLGGYSDREIETLDRACGYFCDLDDD